MVEGIRYLHVYGHASLDNVIEVYANGKLLPPPSIESQIYPHDSKIGKVLYSFETDLSLGSTLIEIKVLQGKILLSRARVQYPARFYNDYVQVAQGYLFSYQPIADPKFLVTINSELKNKPNSILQGEWHYSLRTGDVMKYHHLMLEQHYSCRHIDCNVDNLYNDAVLYYDDTTKSFFYNDEKLNFTYYKDLTVFERLEIYKRYLLSV